MGSCNGPAVLQLQFLVNEGALVSATSDDMLHLWNIRQKRPEIVHSLKFQREKYALRAESGKQKRKKKRNSFSGLTLTWRGCVPLVRLAEY